MGCPILHLEIDVVKVVLPLVVALSALAIIARTIGAFVVSVEWVSWQVLFRLSDPFALIVRARHGPRQSRPLLAMLIVAPNTVW